VRQISAVKLAIRGFEVTDSGEKQIPKQVCTAEFKEQAVEHAQARQSGGFLGESVDDVERAEGEADDALALP